MDLLHLQLVLEFHQWSYQINNPLPLLRVDEPTIQMIFGTNTSPFAGKDGKFVTATDSLTLTLPLWSLPIPIRPT